jgi:hypothetical protein
VSLVLLIASLLSGIVQGLPSVSATIKNTVGGIVGGLNAVVASGVTTGISEQMVLAALAGVITALKAEPAIPATTLALISGLEDALTAALTADKAAAAAVTPSTLQPVAPLP